MAKIVDYECIEREPLALSYELVPAEFLTKEFIPKAIEVALQLPHLDELSIDMRRGLMVRVLLTKDRDARADLERTRSILNALLKESYQRQFRRSGE